MWNTVRKEVVCLMELLFLHLPSLADRNHGGEMKARFMINPFQSLPSNVLQDILGGMEQERNSLYPSVLGPNPL